VTAQQGGWPKVEVENSSNNQDVNNKPQILCGKIDATEKNAPKPIIVEL